MTSSGLVRMALATAVVVAIWFVTQGDDTPTGRGDADRGPWLAELAGRVNDVTAIELVADGEAFSVSKDGDGWGLDAWGGYPVGFDHVVATVVALSELEVQDAMTSRPDKHEQLQLETPGDGAASLGLTLRDEGGSVLADVVVGKAKGQTGLFVRRAGEDQTWLVSGKLSPPRTPRGWVETELMRLAANDVQRVEARPADGEPYDLVKDESGAWTVEGVPEGRQLIEAHPAAQVAGALAWLEFEAVADAAQAGADRTWSTMRYHGVDGLVTEVHTAETDEGDGAWLRLTFAAAPDRTASEPTANEPTAGDEATGDAAPTEAAADDETETGIETGTETEPTTDPAGPDTSAGEDLSTRVAELTERHGPWTYRIASWKASLLRKELDVYLEPLPVPEAVDGDGDGDGPEDDVEGEAGSGAGPQEPGPDEPLDPEPPAPPGADDGAASPDDPAGTVDG